MTAVVVVNKRLTWVCMVGAAGRLVGVVFSIVQAERQRSKVRQGRQLSAFNAEGDPTRL